MSESLRVAVVLMCLLCGLQEAKAFLSDDTCNFTVLEKSLFENKANKIELSLAFFPLQDNPPEFVKVTYNFGNNTQDWFWSGQTSHFLHPFEVFQFMSLFFSKPEPYYTGTVTLTLRPECAKPGLLPNGNSLLQLLTQRLKLYAEKGDPGITVSDTYSAKAYDDDTLTDLLDNDAKHTANIIICMAVFVIFFSAVIIIMTIIVFYCSKSHTQTEWIKKVENNQSGVLSLTFLSLILTTYILTLAITATSYWNKNENNFLYDKKYNLAPIVTIIFVDLLCFIFWFILVIIAGLSYLCLCKCMSFKCNRSCNNNDSASTKSDGDGTGKSDGALSKKSDGAGKSDGAPSKKSDGAPSKKSDGAGKRDGAPSKKSDVAGKSDGVPSNSDGGADTNHNTSTLVILSLTVLCPTFCVIAHSPYIAIAYLNDGSHASSIFIYYTILCFIFFGVMALFFNWCKKYTYSETESNVCEQDGHSSVSTCKQKKADDDIKEHCMYKCCTRCLEACTIEGDSIKERKCCCPKKICSIACESAVYTLCCSRCWCFVFPLGIAILFLLGLIVTAACYLILIPINKAISDAPNRLVSIYQSGGFLIGSFIVYKVIKYFYNKKNEEKEKNIEGEQNKPSKEKGQQNQITPGTSNPG